MDRISNNITFEEATHNSHGFSNIPDDATLENMKYVATNVFEPVRAFIGKPININSFYRCVLLNRHIGGAYKSQHVSGEAMDLNCAGENDKIFNYIKDNLVFDQLIWEFGIKDYPAWVHVSLIKGKNRKQVLISSLGDDGKIKYIPFV